MKMRLFKKNGIILHFIRLSFGCEKQWMKGERRKYEETEKNKVFIIFNSSLCYSRDTMWTTSKNNDIEGK